jgi:hypothetical protein
MSTYIEGRALILCRYQLRGRALMQFMAKALWQPKRCQPAGCAAFIDLEGSQCIGNQLFSMLHSAHIVPSLHGIVENAFHHPS